MNLTVVLLMLLVSCVFLGGVNNRAGRFLQGVLYLSIDNSRTQWPPLLICLLMILLRAVEGKAEVNVLLDVEEVLVGHSMLEK